MERTRTALEFLLKWGVTKCPITTNYRLSLRHLQCGFAVVLPLFLLGSLIRVWSLSNHIGIGRMTQILRTHTNLSTLGAFKRAQQLHTRLIPRPPIKDMCFIAQKPGKDYKFPDPIGYMGSHFLRMRTYPKMPRPDSCNGCCPYIYGNVLQVPGCSHMTSLKLLIVVTTAPWEYDVRQVIRATWGKNTNQTRTLFLLGVGWANVLQERLIKESEDFKDILQDNYIDSYFNLSLKVLSGYHWWRAHCQEAPFVLRTAADNFIATKTLIHFLHSRPHWPDVIIGRCRMRNSPIRWFYIKWFVSLLEYNRDTYPPYCLGSAFVTSAKTTQLILKTAPDVPYFVQEDVYFGMVMQKANNNGLAISSHDAFEAGYRKTPDHKCNVKNGWISIHNVRGTKEMLWISENCDQQSRN